MTIDTESMECSKILSIAPYPDYEPNHTRKQEINASSGTDAMAVPERRGSDAVCIVFTTPITTVTSIVGRRERSIPSSPHI